MPHSNWHINRNPKKSHPRYRYKGPIFSKKSSDQAPLTDIVEDMTAYSEFAADPAWQTLYPSRECGDCYACCTWLGIDALRKYAGQSCKHLTGAGDPNHRCSIYPIRPQACSAYQCMWLSGLMPSEFRPHDSGILITPYQVSDGAALTIMVFDPALAREGKKINRVIQQCMMMPLIVELRIVYPQERKALYLRDGRVYACDIVPPTRAEKYESLSFQARSEPIAHYLTRSE